MVSHIPARALPRTTQSDEPHMLIAKSIGPLTNKKLAAKLRSPTSPSALSTETQNRGSIDGRRQSEAAIDPLSQVCPYRASNRTGREANSAFRTCSKSSRGQTHRLPYTSYGHKIQMLQHFRRRPRPMKRTRIRSRVESHHAT
jgi:hypothetical protein